MQINQNKFAYIKSNIYLCPMKETIKEIKSMLAEKKLELADISIESNLSDWMRIHGVIRGFEMSLKIIIKNKCN